MTCLHCHIVKNEEANRREHLFCAFLLGLVATFLAALYYGILTHPFISPWASFTNFMGAFARIVLGLMAAVCVIRLFADLYQALAHHREIQSLNWHLLSIKSADC